jgi:hypothetical protein
MIELPTNTAHRAVKFHGSDAGGQDSRSGLAKLPNPIEGGPSVKIHGGLGASGSEGLAKLPTLPVDADPEKLFSQGQQDAEPEGETYAPAFIEIAQRFSFHTCAACGLTFAMPAETYLHRLRDKGHLYCPGCGALEELTPMNLATAEALVKALAVMVDLRQARGSAA